MSQEKVILESPSYEWLLQPGDRYDFDENNTAKFDPEMFWGIVGSFGVPN